MFVFSCARRREQRYTVLQGKALQAEQGKLCDTKLVFRSVDFRKKKFGSL